MLCRVSVVLSAPHVIVKFEISVLVTKEGKGVRNRGSVFVGKKERVLNHNWTCARSPIFPMTTRCCKSAHHPRRAWVLYVYVRVYKWYEHYRIRPWHQTTDREWELVGSWLGGPWTTACRPIRTNSHSSPHNTTDTPQSNLILQIYSQFPNHFPKWVGG